MGDHITSPEALWLAENYAGLEEYAGRWIAVIGNEVVDSSSDLVDLQRSLNDHGISMEPCLFARVVVDRLG